MNTPCVDFRGRPSSEGYGHVKVGRQNVKAHRLAYRLYNGPIGRGMCVCHRCDNRLCINPAHLFLGTRADNNADRARKGRSADQRGEKSPRAKLSNAQVREIKQLLARGATRKELAHHYSVDNSTIGKIKQGRNWKST